ncbi:MAG: metallophosphoesterase [Synechococcaceae cyanobacterium SM2_3_1]|nr:metallophosphoesterase [Synechococcaceae cyanobacterium SM2_3_1]
MRRRNFWMAGAAVLGGGVAGAALAWYYRPQPETIANSSPSGSSPEAPSATPQPASTPTTRSVLGLPRDLYIPPRRDVRLMVTSDLNASYGSVDYDLEVDRAIQLIPYWQPDIVIGAGDMVAGQDPRLSVERLKAMWVAFDEHFGSPLREAGLPYGFTVGNHDASSYRSVKGTFLFQKERDETANYWNDPAHDPGLQFIDKAGFPFYYTFEHAGIFFLVWDASSNWIPPEQMAWAEASLSSAKAQSAPLRIVIGHLPLYGVATGRNELGEILDNAEEKRALLERYRVHTYISGHHHAYYPAHKGQLQLLHCGILGSGPRPLINTPLVPRKTLTLVDVDFHEVNTFYTTYNMQTMELIDQGELPRFLTGANGVVIRRDVEWQDLSPEELATCRSQIGDLCRA